LAADVLPENIAMLNVLGKLGFQIRGVDPQVIHLRLTLI
jgi:RimJ/RimL family protein N-acetyltransferase